jgi:hypothetical protein
MEGLAARQLASHLMTRIAASDVPDAAQATPR